MGVLIYEGDAVARVEFETDVRRLYSDFLALIERDAREGLLGAMVGPRKAWQLLALFCRIGATWTTWRAGATRSSVVISRSRGSAALPPLGRGVGPGRLGGGPSKALPEAARGVK